MLLTMLSARLPCSAIFSRLPVSISIVSSTSARLSVAERRDRRRRCLLQLVEQFDRQAGEVVDEVERVLDLVGDPGGQLAERGHLLGLDQIGLRRLQVAIGGFGGVAGRADLGLRPLALGDVAVDQHEAAIGHRVAANLDDPAIWSRALEAQFLVGVFEAAAEFRLDVVGAELAAFGEDAEVVGIARALGQKRVGQVEQLLEIAVPRGQPQVFVEHGDAIGHVVEGDPQLGLTLADFVEQPRILHRDHRLGGEVLQQCDLLVGEGPDLPPVDRDSPMTPIVLPSRMSGTATNGRRYFDSDCRTSRVAGR